MRILCVDDEPLALQMLMISIQKAKPDAEVDGFEEPEDLLEEADTPNTRARRCGCTRAAIL